MVEEERNPLDRPLGPTADPKQVKEKGEKAKSRIQRDIDDMATILSDVRGRRFLWRYLQECGVFKTSFNNSGSVTAFNEGMRNIGLKLLAEIMEADSEAYTLMATESKKENQNG
jgi:hypothetical protein